MNRRNYQRELEAVIKENESKSRVPRLLLHSCCAPCSSYVLEYLSRYFSITELYYNPNISQKAEYEKRAAELLRLTASMPQIYPVKVEIPPWDPEPFQRISKGLEEEPEGGARCQGLFCPASEGSSLCSKGWRVRLFLHHPFHQPSEGFPASEPIGRGHWEGTGGAPICHRILKRKRVTSVL